MVNTTKRLKEKSPSVSFFSMPRWLLLAGSHPLFGMGTAIAAVIAGVCASLFTDGIRNSWNSVIPSANSSDGAFYFWAFLVGAGFLFWINQAALTNRQNRARHDLETAVRRLNTLPSETFLPTYKGCWTKASSTTLVCIVAHNKGQLSIDSVEASIRIVLLGVIEAAKDFDGTDDGIEYAANVMLWREKRQGIECQNPVELIEAAASVGSEGGVLELVPALSTKSPSGAIGSADDKTQAVLLPIPESQENFLDDDGAERLVVLPGAPYTFVTGRQSVFPTVQDFILTLRNRTTFDDRVIRKITLYFTQGQGSHIRSFSSFAIMGSPKSQLPIAVLNIHSTQQGLLEGRGDLLFAPLLEPFLTLLAVLLSIRADVLKTPVRPPASSGGA